MDSKTIQAADTKKLAKLLSPQDSTATLYEGADLAVILRHQLDAPIAEELSLPICGAEDRSTPMENLDPSLKTFGDLLTHPYPPVDLLKRAKDFAKSCRANPNLLPLEVATLLYYAAIAAAQVRHHQKITDMDDPALRMGLNWAIAQPWLDGSLRPMFQDAIDLLGT